jgi:putative ABC transport system substrate-binding protein
MHYVMLRWMEARLGLLVARSGLVVPLVVVILAASFVAAAQTRSKVFLVGHLFGGGRTPDGLPPRALRDTLRELGYVEGRNVTYEARFAEGQIDQLPSLAAELVRLKVDVIVAQGGAAAVAAKQATSTIPIVIAPASGDAVAPG